MTVLEAVETAVPVRVRPDCSVDDCSKPAVSRGLCQAHYRRLLRRGNTDLVNTKARGKQCVCGKPVLARGLCRGCYDAETASRRPKRDLDTLCLHGGPDDRPACLDGHVRYQLCGDLDCLEPFHCDQVPDGFPMQGAEFLAKRNTQLRARLRAFDNF